MTTYTIETAKGSYTSSNLEEVYDWQARMQGAWAALRVVHDGKQLELIDVDDIDFDAHDECGLIALACLVQEKQEEEELLGLCMAQYRS